MTNCPYARPERRIRMHLVQAYTRAESPETIAHLHAALRDLDTLAVDAGDLARCPDCGRTGFPERIDAHDCPA